MNSVIKATANIAFCALLLGRIPGDFGFTPRAVSPGAAGIATGQPKSKSQRASTASVARVRKAQRTVDRLALDLYNARRRLVALEKLADAGEHHPITAREGGASVDSVSSITVLATTRIGAGFERGDDVVVVRKTSSGNTMIVAVGKVGDVEADSVEFQITSRTGAWGVNPGDKVYIIGRSDSPSSLVEHYK